jgi:hypothetical protein
MKGLRNRLMTVACAGGLVVAGLGVTATPAFAKGAPINGSGSVSCTLTTGSIKFSPGLPVSGTTTNQVTIKAAETCTGDNGSMSAKVSGSFKLDGSQASLAGCNVVSIPLVIKWKGGTNHLNMTDATGDSGGGVLNSMGLSFEIPGTISGAGCASDGVCTITGSYAGETCANSWNISGLIQNKKTLAVKKVLLAGGTTTIHP